MMRSLYLSSSLALLQLAHANNQVCPDKYQAPTGHPAVPCIVIPKCDQKSKGCDSGNYAIIDDFTVIEAKKKDGPLIKTYNGEKDKYTKVCVCHNDRGLKLHWELEGKPAAKSLAKGQEQCQPQPDVLELWNSDSANLMIAPLAENFTPETFDPVEYAEYDVGPKGGMWLGDVINEDGYLPDFDLTENYSKCNEKIEAKPRVTENGWVLEEEIPFSLIERTKSPRMGERAFRANFLRWRDALEVNESPKESPTDRVLTAWSQNKCDDKKEFQCNTPHVAKYFGTIVLMDGGKDVPMGCEPKIVTETVYVDKNGNVLEGYDPNNKAAGLTSNSNIVSVTASLFALNLFFGLF
eukprot:Pgem_evm1s286